MTFKAIVKRPKYLRRGVRSVVHIRSRVDSSFFINTYSAISTNNSTDVRINGVGFGTTIAD